MKEDITDFDVRVWDNDVMINGRNIAYWGGDERKGLQCDAPNMTTYEEIGRACDDIRKQFIKLKELLKE